MGDVVDLFDRSLDVWAKEFVDVYKKYGKVAAATVISQNVEVEYFPRLRQLIRNEFEAQGWTFPEEVV